MHSTPKVIWIKFKEPFQHLAATLEKSNFPLRSIENEWGPGQLECTFAPLEALECSRQPHPFPHCDSTGMPSNGFPRELYVSPRTKRLLFKRLAFTPIPCRRQQWSQPLYATTIRRIALAPRPELPRQGSCTMRWPAASLPIQP